MATPLSGMQDAGPEGVSQASDRRFPGEIQPMPCIGKTPAKNVCFTFYLKCGFQPTESAAQLYD
jgi:hypothetical protein